MERGNRQRLFALSILVLPAFAYIVLMQKRMALTGENRFDGIIGALLGLYICSLAAADLLDMVLTRVHQSSKLTNFQWAVLNIVFLLLGLIVIFMGTTRFTSIG